MSNALPIDATVPAIRAALSGGPRLVVAAPPGAGKTTRLPLALLDEAWMAGGRMLLLEPRRLAARMAAERMAGLLGERVGERVGLVTRIDRKLSERTRIEVLTDGLFSRRIVADPALSGVALVLFDEFHERSLSLDLGLALALDAQAALRPDLKLVVMSATLDTARVAAALGAPVIESEGRAFPVETVYLGRGDGPVEEGLARGVRRALRENQGSVLAFLPGRGEILRAAERLSDLPGDVIVAPLFGALSPAEQDAAVRPAPAGARKVVLATDIAESALTIEGVNVVVDAGLARVAEYDAETGSAQLVTRRAARANVDQRRGRAGRTAPGVCYRLWDEEATRGLAAAPTPEILNGDLSGLVLTLAEWGERDASRLVWIDAPPAGRLVAAHAELAELGALDSSGALTERGRAMARLPLEPRLAAMIAGAKTQPDRALAAEIAALASERGLGGSGADIVARLDRFRRDNGARASTLRAQAARWGGGAEPSPARDAGRVIAAALPGRIARRKAYAAGDYLMASGRAARLDRNEALASAPWLAVADLTGAASGARIVAAAPLDEGEALALGGVETLEIASFDAAERTLKARRVRRLGAIVLSETPLPRPSGEAARRALLEAVAAHGLDLLPAAWAIRETQARLALARAHFGEDWSAPDDAALIARAGEWLAPLLGDPPSLDRPDADRLRTGLAALLDWKQARDLDDIAPLSVTTPAGRALKVDYLSEGGPRIEARVQEFYGLAAHPSIARGRAPLTLSLLSPARRQIAVTGDLPSFWKGGYRDMAKDMRGQYPKHDWPDDPAAARPHEGRTRSRL